MWNSYAHTIFHVALLFSIRVQVVEDCFCIVLNRFYLNGHLHVHVDFVFYVKLVDYNVINYSIYSHVLTLLLYACFKITTVMCVVYMVIYMVCYVSSVYIYIYIVARLGLITMDT